MRFGMGSTMGRKHRVEGFGRKSAGKSAKRSLEYFLNAVLMCCLGAALSTAWAQAAPAQDSAASGTQAAPVATTPPGEPTYKPKFPGDPARSESEAAALGYMRVVLRAQRQFNKQYDHFATTLAELVHSGTFTKRMVNTNRGDYTASFAGKKDSFVLTMTPKQLDAQHRSFYAEDDFKIHADETKAADENSPVVK
ncbi:MAG: hypothetical protein ABR921_09470 [Candidatus Sulfotelmatobacter sp.]|jgi:hypothetical protein